MRLELRRSLSLPFFPVIFTPFILYAGVLFQGGTLFWGLPALQFIPWQAYAWQQLSHGTIPLWNPYNGMGAPFLANYQLGLFYPPTWIGYLLAAIGGTSAMAWGQTLLIPLHLAVAGVGMALLARRMGLGVLAQTISGLAFGMGGYLVARSGFYTMIWAGAWVPWELWAASKFTIPIRGRTTRQSLVSVGLTIVIALQLLAGHAQTAWYSLILTASWVSVGGWMADRWKGLAKSLVTFALSGLLAAGIASIQLLPTAEYLMQSQRSTAVSFETGLTYSFWPWRFLTFLAPNLFGNPGTGNYWGYASFWEDAVYIGILPLALTFTTIAFILPRNKGNSFRPVIQLSWLWIVSGSLLALGNNTPVFPFLYRYVPTFSMFNAPARWMLLPILGLSILAGIGADQWKRPVDSALRRFRLMTAAAVAVTLGAGFTWFLLRNIQITFIEAVALLGIWATGVCLLTLAKPGNAPGQASRRWEWLAIAWLSGDLLWSGWCLQPSIPASVFSQNYSFKPQASLDGRVYIDSQDEYDLKFKRFFRFSDYNPIEDWSQMRQVALPDMNILPGSQFSYVNNFDPILPGNYAQWMDWINTLSNAQKSTAFKLMDVSQMMTRDVHQAIGISINPIESDGRAQWKPCMLPAATQAVAWAKVREAIQNPGSLDLSTTVILTGLYPSVSGDCHPGSKANLIQEMDKPDEIQYDVEASSEGYLFLADTWYPGWKVTVDDRSADLLPSDFLFKSVFVPSGKHSVRFYYQPISFSLGVLISLFSIGIVILILIISRHRVK